MSRIMTFGGGDAVTSVADDRVVTFAVMCNIELRTEEREQTVARPLYEYPLLKKMYEARGGSAKLDGGWLVDKTSGKDCHPRAIPLKRHELREEMARLQATFRIARPNGQTRSIFDEVYGIGPDNRFATVVNDQAKAYKQLRTHFDRINAAQPAGSKSIPTTDDWVKLGDLALPPVSTIDVLEGMDFEDTPVAGLPPVDETVDPTADLQAYLTMQDIAPDIASAVATLAASGKKVTPKELNQIPALAHKNQEIVMVIKHVQDWEKTRAPIEVK